MAHSATCPSLPDAPDILYHVFSYLDPVHQFGDDEVYELRRSLALAARTCRGFAGPALDVLWKRLPDDQPLADLLCEVGIAMREDDAQTFKLSGEEKPSRHWLPYQDEGGYPLLGEAEYYEECWRLSRGYDVKYFLRTAGDPRTQPGWRRFVEYASRVHAITLFAFDGPAWCTIWEELLAPAVGGYFSTALNAAAFSLLSPSVRKLNLNIDNEDWSESDVKLCGMFTHSFDAAPEIDKLRLECHPSSLGLSLLQTHCSHLRHLEVVPPLDPEALKLLAQLPALQHFSISLARRDFPETSLLFAFKLVMTLRVEGTWANLSAFLAAALLPSMHTLSVMGWEYGDPAAELAQGATNCLHTLATRRPSITCLTMSSTDGRVLAPQGCVSYCIPPVLDVFKAVLLDIVHPLLALSALRHLDIVLPDYFDLACTAEDLRAVAEAFPGLEEFHLRIWSYFGLDVEDDDDNEDDDEDNGGDNDNNDNNGGDGVPPNTSESLERPRGGPLDALVHFAQSCPRLRLLHLPEMELTEGALAKLLGDQQPPLASERHALRALIVPKVLLPAGSLRVDLAGTVEEVVRRVFPLAASPFRSGRLTVEGNWAVADGASRCPECERGSSLTFV